MDKLYDVVMEEDEQIASVKWALASLCFSALSSGCSQNFLTGQAELIMIFYRTFYIIDFFGRTFSTDRKKFYICFGYTVFT